MVSISGMYRRDDLFATDPSQFFLHPFRIHDSFDAELIVHAEDDRPAIRVSERDDSLRYLFGVREADL
jgi:hypothetical protein